MKQAILPVSDSEYLAQNKGPGLLRFMTCGSVDDGKSTLIGRMLYEAKMVFEDQLQALEADSKNLERPEKSLILPCWSMASQRSASKESLSTLPIGIFQLKNESLS